MNDMNTPHNTDYYWLAAVCAASATAFPLLALIGWVMGLPALAQWRTGYIPMAPSAALGFALLGVGLFVHVRSPGRCQFAVAAAVLAALLAGVLVAGSVGGFKTALEDLVYDQPLYIQGARIGHTSPITAAVLLLAGLALLALSAPRAEEARARARARLVGPLAVAVTTVGAVVLLGYLYGTPLLYGGAMIPVSLPTAATMLLMGMGLLAAAGPQAWPLRLMEGDSVGARMARALLPVMLCLIVGGNWVAIGMFRAGINPMLGVAIMALLALAAVSVIIVFIGRSVGGEIDRAEAARRGTEERFRLFYEGSPIPYQTMDAEGRLLDVNQAFLEATGYEKKQDVRGRWCGELLNPASRKWMKEHFADLKEQGGMKQMELEAVRRDGSHLDILVDASVGYAADGAFQQIHWVWSDITDRKRAQATLAEAKAVAEAASHAKDRLMATVSHELRTPLTPLLIRLSMLQEDPQMPAALQESLAMMRHSVEVESHLIDGLLDLTRMTQGRVHLKPEVVDAHELVERALAMSAEEDDAMGPTIRCELKAMHHMVHVDPTRMQQVCWNIIKNAKQYTPLGGTLTIESENTDAQMLELRFIDTGAGIDPDFLPRVFDAFERGSSMGHVRPSGLGLGMAIAKSLMQQLGGSIHVASEGLGKGSTFTVRLPLAAATESTGPARPTQPLCDGVAGPVRILLVEDDDATREVMTEVLRTSGHEVVTAATMKQALAAAESGEFDLLVSDIGLPDGSGLDVMRWFKDHRPIPGIAVSGYGTEEDLQRSLAAGFFTHITKPIPASTLRWAIQEAMAPVPGS